MLKTNARTNESDANANCSKPQTIPNIVLEQNKDITRTVKVTSLVGNILTLSTMKNGNKRVEHINLKNMDKLNLYCFPISTNI
jgi:hypothetical protein